MTTLSSRRAVLAGLATSPAAIAAAAVPAAAAANHPDEELLRLADQCISAAPRHSAQRGTKQTLGFAPRAHASEAIGARRARWDAARKQVADEIGFTAAEQAADEAHGKWCDLLSDVQERRAKTLDGVIAKARIVSSCFGDELPGPEKVLSSTAEELAYSVVRDLLAL